MGQCRYQKQPKTGAEAERGQIGLLFGVHSAKLLKIEERVNK